MADNTSYTPGSGATIAARDAGSGVLHQRVQPTVAGADVAPGAGLPVSLTDNATVAFSTTTAQAVASTDAASYSWASVHFTSAGTSSVVTFQGSNDNVNWVSVQMYQVAAIPGASAVSATSATAGLVYSGTLHMRYFRLNVTGISAGTTAGTVQFSATPRNSQVQSVSNVTTQAVSPANTEVTGTFNSGSDPIASTDVRGYSFVIISLTGGNVSNTVRVSFSNDNATWTQGHGYQPETALAPILSVTNAASGFGQAIFPVIGRYMKVVSYNYVSQSTAVTVELVSSATLPFGINGIPVYLSQALSVTADTELAAAAALADSATNPTTALVGALGQGYNGASWDRKRLPNIAKTATATASGDTALWTPTSGKKFRIMRYRIEVTSDAATSGGAEIDIVLRDATTALGIGASLYVPAVAGTAFGNGYSTGWCDLGNGILSSAANAVLNTNLSAALTSGKVRVNAVGVEE